MYVISAFSFWLLCVCVWRMWGDKWLTVVGLGSGLINYIEFNIYFSGMTPNLPTFFKKKRKKREKKKIKLRIFKPCFGLLTQFFKV